MLSEPLLHMSAKRKCKATKNSRNSNYATAYSPGKRKIFGITMAHMR